MTRLDRIVRDGNWFAHRYDPDQDTVHFVHLPRQAHRAAIFLTDEYLPVNLERIVLPRQAAVDAAAPAKAANFIFHSAFCGSTLLARAFDIPGTAMGLKEPPIYNDIVGWRHRGGGPPARIAQVLDQVTTLLARPIDGRESAIIKPSNLINGLARGLLAMRDQSCAVLLYAPLETFLQSIAKKEMDGRIWVRDLLVKLLKEGIVDLGFTTEDYIGQTDLQAAAVGWLAQHALFARLAIEFPDRVRTLDSETLFARPIEALSALCRLFQLEVDPRTIDTIIGGPAFTTHSKSQVAFGSTERSVEYANAAETHADEIGKVLVWAGIVAEGAGISMIAPRALLDS